MPPYSRDWGEQGRIEVIADRARVVMPEVAVADCGPGDMVVFRMRQAGVSKHIGVLTRDRSVIHSRERLGVIEEPFTDSWRRRVAFAFKFPHR